MAVGKNRDVRSVSFSSVDPFEQKLLKHADNNGVFSRYIKRLIQRDMEGITQRVMMQTSHTPPQSFFTQDIEKTQTPPVFQQEEPQEKPQSVSSFI